MIHPVSISGRTPDPAVFSVDDERAGRRTRPVCERLASGEAAQVLAAAVLQRLEFGEGDLEVGASLFEVGPSGVDLGEEVLELSAFTGVVVVHVDDATDLLEREAETSPAQHEVEPGAVAAVEEPLGASPLGGEQAEGLVVPDRPMGDVELLRNLRDGARLVVDGWCRTGCHTRDDALR